MHTILYVYKKQVITRILRGHFLLPFTHFGHAVVRRTKQAAQATREQLLDAAETLFLAHGIGHTSLHDIAVAAGLTRGAVYWHFADKEALLHALMERVRLPWEQARVQIEQHSESDPWASLCALARLPLQLLRDEPRCRRMLTITNHRSEGGDGELPGSEASKQAFLSLANDLFKMAQRHGQVRTTLAAGPALLGLMAMIDGLLRHLTLTPDNFDALEEGAQAVDLYLGSWASIAPTPAQPNP